MNQIRPWLIQRGTFKDISLDEITGIDSLVRWHYMGSAEFEFGGFKRSLERVIDSLVDYAAWPTDLIANDGRTLVLFCRPADRAELVRILHGLRDGNVRLKEAAHLKSALRCGDKYDPNFWWDIDNDWMAWLGEENTERVKHALEKVTEKWSK